MQCASISTRFWTTLIIINDIYLFVFASITKPVLFAFLRKYADYLFSKSENLQFQNKYAPIYTIASENACLTGWHLSVTVNYWKECWRLKGKVMKWWNNRKDVLGQLNPRDLWLEGCGTGLCTTHFSHHHRVVMMKSLQRCCRSTCRQTLFPSHHTAVSARLSVSMLEDCIHSTGSSPTLRFH